MIISRLIQWSPQMKQIKQYLALQRQNLQQILLLLLIIRMMKRMMIIKRANLY